MNLSDLNPKSVSLVQAGEDPQADSGADQPLKLSALKPDAITLVSHGPTEQESALRGAISGATAGFDDELTGAVGAAGRLAGYKNLGSWKPFDPNSHLERTDAPLSRDELLSAYRSNRDAIRGQQSVDMEANPASTIAGNVAGAFISPVAKVGAAGKGLGAAVKAGATQGAIYGAGGSNSDLTQGEVGQFAKDAALGAGIGAAVPVVAKGVTEAAKAGVGLGKWAATKSLSLAGGVKPQVINEYMQFADRISHAPTAESLKNISDEFVGKLSSDVDAKKLTADQAANAYKAFESDLKDGFRTAGYDAREALSSAKESLKDAHNARVQGLAQDVYDTVAKLKADISKGSSESFGILDKEGGSIPVAPLKSKLTGLISDLKIAGKSAVGDDANAAVTKLQSIRDTLDNFPKSLPMTEAKKMLQQLQLSTKYAYGAGEFSQSADSALKDFNATLNSGLKSRSPAYAAKMQEVSGNADLLKRVSDFGDRAQAASLLTRLDSPNQLERRAALQELGKKYGADFLSAAKPESLPENQLVSQAQSRLDSLRPDRVAEKVDTRLASSPQRAALGSAQAELDAAQQKLAPFKSLAPNAAGQTQAQQKLAQLAKGGNIELEGMFRELGKLTDTDFIQAVKDRHILAAFEKGAMNGSRNTLMGSVAGFAFGGVGGAAGGAAVGRAVDQWGPAITKKILDGVLAVSKRPSMQTIAALDIPEPVKRNIVLGLQNYLAKEGSAVGEAKWIADGARKVALDDSDTERARRSPAGRKLLIEASDLPKDSPRLKRIKEQLSRMGDSNGR